LEAIITLISINLLFYFLKNILKNKNKGETKVKENPSWIQEEINKERLA